MNGSIKSSGKGKSYLSGESLDFNSIENFQPVNHYVNEGPAPYSHDSFKKYSGEKKDEGLPMTLTGLGIDLIRKLFGWFGDTKEEGDGLYKGIDSKEIREFLENVKYRISDTKTLEKEYKANSKTPYLGSLGGLWVPEYMGNRLEGGTIYKNKIVEGDSSYDKHEVGHAVLDYMLSKYGINPESVDNETHERFANNFERDMSYEARWMN